MYAFGSKPVCSGPKGVWERRRGGEGSGATCLIQPCGVLLASLRWPVVYRNEYPLKVKVGIESGGRISANIKNSDRLNAPN